jgi:hypothetical protein
MCAAVSSRQRHAFKRVHLAVGPRWWSNQTVLLCHNPQTSSSHLQRAPSLFVNGHTTDSMRARQTRTLCQDRECAACKHTVIATIQQRMSARPVRVHSLKGVCPLSGCRWLMSAPSASACLIALIESSFTAAKISCAPYVLEASSAPCTKATRTTTNPITCSGAIFDWL